MLRLHEELAQEFQSLSQLNNIDREINLLIYSLTDGSPLFPPMLSVISNGELRIQIPPQELTESSPNQSCENLYKSIKLTLDVPTNISNVQFPLALVMMI
ncbi:hypothetical protein ACFFRR_007073 [Megaselia abdita]